jgi:chemotaxis methyl-accepting protein methylase
MVERTDDHEKGDPALVPGATKVYRGDIRRLLSKVQEERGLDLSQYREAYVDRRVASRLRTLRLSSYRQYTDYLDAHPEEYTNLLDTLTINVTDFYRDEAVFDLFRKEIVPAMIKEKLASRQRMIRVWSAGCATGEEPYSIAMSFMDSFGKHGDEFLLSILASDLDEAALDTARAATYDLDKLKNIPSRHRLKYLDVAADSFTVKPEVVSHLRFKRLNLFADKPMSIVDVVFCRNVFIYFSREQQARVLDMFWSALARGGYLVLGRSERLAPEVAKRFELVSGRERIYRKPDRR